MIVMQIEVDYPDLSFSDEHRLADALRASLRLEIPREAAKVRLKDRRGFVNPMKLDVFVKSELVS